jgi:hypothetical protein
MKLKVFYFVCFLIVHGKAYLEIPQLSPSYINLLTSFDYKYILAEFKKLDTTVYRQTPILENVTFFCDVKGFGARSKTVPNSVHKLRPGDIDVVGAIGDSQTTGNGIVAIDITQIHLEGRGQAWSIGGQQTWRQLLTIPNILKEFNPSLYGYSVFNNKNEDEKSPQFNVAVAGV